MKKIKKVLLGMVAFIFAVSIMYINTANAQEVKDPKLVLESYEVVTKQLTAGNDGVVRLVIKNESKKIDALNVLLSYVSVEDKIYPVYGKSNQVYIGKIAAGQKVSVDVHVSVSDVLDTNRVLTTFELAGTDGSKDFFNQFFIAIPVIEKMSFRINNVSLAQTSVLGAKSLVSVGFSNNGLEDIYNAVMHMEGEIDLEQKIVNIGDIAAGENKYLDYYVIFQKEGNQPLKIYFTYEDKNGNEYTSEINENNVKVTDSADMDEQKKDGNVKNSNESSISWIVFLIIGVLLLAGVSVSIVIKNKR